MCFISTADQLQGASMTPMAAMLKRRSRCPSPPPPPSKKRRRFQEEYGEVPPHNANTSSVAFLDALEESLRFPDLPPRTKSDFLHGKPKLTMRRRKRDDDVDMMMASSASAHHFGSLPANDKLYQSCYSSSTSLLDLCMPLQYEKRADDSFIMSHQQHNH